MTPTSAHFNLDTEDHFLETIKERTEDGTIYYQIRTRQMFIEHQNKADAAEYQYAFLLHFWD